MELVAKSLDTAKAVVVKAVSSTLDITSKGLSLLSAMVKGQKKISVKIEEVDNG